MSMRTPRRFGPPGGPGGFNAIDGGPGGRDTGMTGMFGGIGNAGGIGLWSLLAALFARGNATETLMLLLYGIMIESGRRLFTWLSERILIKPSITAVFREGDPAYEWIMLYLTQENVWRKSRVFEVSAKSTMRKWHINTSSYFPSTVPGALNADYVPNWATPHMFAYRGYWVDVVKTGHEMGGSGRMGGMHYGMYPVGAGGSIRLTFFTGIRIKMTVLSDFVEECRTRYLDSNRPRVIIHLSDSGMISPAGEWGNVKTKTRRPLSTLALEPGVMDTLLADVKEFLDVEGWYAEAGIPHHRGYLLHGPPGTGKTSTIYALAGELGLEIYSLSLAAGYIDDAYLQRLATSVPRGAILLIEDIDCAFPSREDDDGQGAPEPRRRGPGGVIGGTFMPSMHMGYRNTGVTLSGLLNVIDGVGSDEGRLFFATTNHYDRLDPALVRPGRIDMKIEYKKAGKLQALALFNRFFSPSRFEITNETPSAEGALQVADTAGLRHRRGASGSFADPPKAKQPLSAPLADLAHRFVTAIPEDEFSAAEIQGFLLDCKWNPDAAADGVAAWVAKEKREREAQVEREKERKRKQKEKEFEQMPALPAPGHQGFGGFAGIGHLGGGPGFPGMPMTSGGPTPLAVDGHGPLGFDHPRGGYGSRGGRGRGRGGGGGGPPRMPSARDYTAGDDDDHGNGVVPPTNGGVESDDSARTLSTESEFLDVGRSSPSPDASPTKGEHVS